MQFNQSISFEVAFVLFTFYISYHSILIDSLIKYHLHSLFIKSYYSLRINTKLDHKKLQVMFDLLHNRHNLYIKKYNNYW